MARDDENFDRPEGSEEHDFEFSVGDDAGPDIDDTEFEIGDSPYGDSTEGFDDNDIVGEIDDMDSFGLTADDEDVLGETITQSGSDISQEDIDAFPGEEEPQEDAHQEQWDEDVDEEGINEEPVASSGLGWKAWAGLITAAVTFAAGAVVVMLPSSPERPQVAMQQVQAPATQQTQGAAPRENNQVTAPATISQKPAAPSVANSVQAPARQQSVQAQPIDLGMEPQRPDQESVVTNASDRQQPGSSPIRDPQAEEPVRDITATERTLAENFATKEDFGGLKSLVDEQGTQLGGLTQAMNRTEETLKSINSRLTAIEQRLEKEPEKVSKADPEKKRQPDESVKEAQVVLAAYNYNPGPIDGLMGRKTSAAIERFQNTHGLTVNGELNKETLEAMNGDVKRFAGKANSTAKPQQNQSSEDTRWYVRGVTTDRAIVYRSNGSSYMVSLGTEVPGMGQVLGFDPAQNTVKTVNGTIRTQ